MEYLHYIFVLILSVIALCLTLIVRRDCLDREGLKRYRQRQQYAPSHKPRLRPSLRDVQPEPAVAQRTPVRVEHQHFSREIAGADEAPRATLGINWDGQAEKGET